MIYRDARSGIIALNSQRGVGQLQLHEFNDKESG